MLEEDISPFCGATDTPVLDFWWHLLWVSKPEWAALCTCLVEVYVLHVPWYSPLVWYLPTSWQPAWQPSQSLPYTCNQALVGLEWETYSTTGERSTDWARLLISRFYFYFGTDKTNQTKRCPDMNLAVDIIIWIYVLSMAWDHFQETVYFGLKRYMVRLHYNILESINICAHLCLLQTPSESATDVLTCGTCAITSSGCTCCPWPGTTFRRRSTSASDATWYVVVVRAYVTVTSRCCKFAHVIVTSRCCPLMWHTR